MFQRAVLYRDVTGGADPRDSDPKARVRPFPLGVTAFSCRKRSEW